MPGLIFGLVPVAVSAFVIAVVVYLLYLAKRFVEAVEKIAEK